MKIYLDDLRTPPQDWTLVKTVEEVLELLRTQIVTHMSLDCDLGHSYMCESCRAIAAKEWDCGPGCECDCHTHHNEWPTGITLVKQMIEQNLWPLNKPMVHSANIIGGKEMRLLIEEHWNPPVLTQEAS